MRLADQLLIRRAVLSGMLIMFLTVSRTFLVKLFAAVHNGRDLASGTPSDN